MMHPSHKSLIQKYTPGKTTQAEEVIPVEAAVSLTVNSEVWTTFMCTPLHLEALVLGFLFNEGIIDSMDDVADVRVCEHGDNVDVWTAKPVEKPARWRRTTGCAGGVTGVDAADSPRPVLPQSEASIAPEQIVKLVEMLFESQELYKEAGGTHTSVLSDGEQILLSAEDIGRHNTLDKLAGFWLQGKHQWTANRPRVLVSTGRISSEMLQKSVRMGASILVSRTSPTSLSVELAEKLGTTLIGYARRQRFNIYTHPELVQNTADQSAG